MATRKVHDFAMEVQSPHAHVQGASLKACGHVLAVFLSSGQRERLRTSAPLQPEARRAAMTATVNARLVAIEDIDTTVNHEPRIEDLKLAEALGFSDKHKIRELIKKHRPSLEEFGEVSAVERKPTAKGGRPGRTFYLNRKQALFITAKSETERAAIVTVQMVEVFDAVMSKKEIGTVAFIGNVVAVRGYIRRAPATERLPSRIGDAEFWRRSLREAQYQLARRGEIYPTVVPSSMSARSPLGEALPFDLTREALCLPDGSFVIPVRGGGWQHAKASEIVAAPRMIA